MLSRIFILIFLMVYSRSINAQIISQSVEVPKNGSLELSDSNIVVENFILNENSVLTFKNGIKSVKINCKLFKVMDGARIIGPGEIGTNGQKGMERNKHGSHGRVGTNGVNFTIVCDTFSFCDFTANLSGGNGGNGGNGIKGNKGERAHCCKHDASNGDRGGNGGNGGNGGESGDFSITYNNLISPCNTTLTSQNFVLKGGIGGKKGLGGLGGDGGNKADKCALGCNRDGGRRGPKGRDGTIGITPRDKKFILIKL